MNTNPSNVGSEFFGSLVYQGICRQVGLKSPVEQTVFLERLALYAGVAKAAELIPATKEEHCELVMLAQNGPPRTELYYRWAVAILEEQRRQATKSAT